MRLFGGKKVIERLFEFSVLARPGNIWQIRVWCQMKVEKGVLENLLPSAADLPAIDFTERIAAVRGVNAVQVKYTNCESVVIYPSWP